MSRTETEKQLAGEMFDCSDATFIEIINRARDLILEYNSLKSHESERKAQILNELLGEVGENVYVDTPFYCDYGIRTKIGDNVYIGLNCVFVDNNTITQAALGTCIAQAGFTEKLGRKSLLVGAVCGLLPDFDFLLSIGGDRFTYLATHRGWSHSIFLLPIFAFPVAWLAMKWAIKQKKPLGKLQQESQTEVKPPSIDSYWTWYHLCFWVLFTHPLLDVFTSYGTQLLAPFSSGRYALDGIAIIDPIYTIPLIAAMVLALMRPQQLVRYRKWARNALIFSGLYLCLGLFNSWGAKRVAVAQLAEESFEAVDVRSAPTMFNTLLWRIVAKDSGGSFAVGFYSTIARKPIKFIYLKSEHNELVQKAISSKQGEIFRWFSTDMLRAELRTGKTGADEVVLADMRYGLVSKQRVSFFAAVFEFDKEHNLSRAYPSRENMEGLEFGREFKSMWSMMWNGKN